MKTKTKIFKKVKLSGKERIRTQMIFAKEIRPS